MYSRVEEACIMDTRLSIFYRSRFFIQVSILHCSWAKGASANEAKGGFNFKREESPIKKINDPIKLGSIQIEERESTTKIQELNINIYFTLPSNIQHRCQKC